MKKRRRKRRLKIIVPVASMGDIAFLLIIFFMICSRFAKEAGVKVEPPRSIDVEQLENYPTIVAIDEDGRIFFQGNSIGSADTLESLVRSELAGREGQKERTVLFRCDKGVPKRIYEPVIEAIAEGGGRPALVGVEASREK